MRNLSRRRVIRGLASLALAPVFAAASLPRAAETKPVAIKGYDPVAYFTIGKPVQGRRDIEYQWDERRYRFSSKAHRDVFRADPFRYAPQFPDFCAMSLTRGEIVEADPQNWLIADGKLYMFGKSIGPALFKQDLAENTARANQNRGLVQKK